MFDKKKEEINYKKEHIKKRTNWTILKSNKDWIDSAKFD